MGRAATIVRAGKQGRLYRRRVVAGRCGREKAVASAIYGTVTGRDPGSGAAGVLGLACRLQRCGRIRVAKWPMRSKGGEGQCGAPIATGD